MLPTSVIGDAVPAEVVAVAAPDREYGADFVSSTGSATTTSRRQLRPTTPMPAVAPAHAAIGRVTPQSGMENLREHPDAPRGADEPGQPERDC